MNQFATFFSPKRMTIQFDGLHQNAKSLMRRFAIALAFLVIPALATATTFDVKNTLDAGPGSLRQAILDSNADPTAIAVAPHEIVVDAAASGTITLLSALPSIDNFTNINVTNPVALTVDGGGASAIFSVGNTSDVRLSTLTIANGGASGLTVGAGSTFALANFTFAGDLTLGAGGTVTGTGTIRFSTDVGNTQTVNRAINGAYSLVKDGAGGTLVLNAASSRTGTTTVNAGILRLGAAGALGSGAVTNAGGVIQFASPITVNTGNFTQSLGGALDVAADAACAVGKLNVTGTVTLAGTLNFSLGSCAPSLGQVLTFILNNGSDLVSGTFSGLAEGAVFTQAGLQFTISYKGGTNNDVTLTRTGPLNSQTITFPAVASPKNIGQTELLTATASSGLTVTYTAAPANVCTMSGNTANFIGAGTCTLTAKQAGNATYSPAPDVQQTISVVGVPAVTLTPATLLSFPDQQLGTTSAKLDVTVTNSGTAPLNVSVIAITGDYAQTNTCGAAIAPNGNCTISVTFTPTVAGQRSGGLGFSSNAPTTPHNLPLIGNGVLGTQAITFGAAPAVSVGGNGTVSATGGPSGLPVIFTSATPAVCTHGGTNGSTITGVTTGTCTIRANQAGNANYS
ncbi:MAG: choice-of-anchor D domain-containing protein, partial [Burkholderiales bacterium]